MDQDTELPYKIFRKTEDDQELFVSSRKDLAEAERFVGTLNESWPGDYLIRGPE